MAAVWAKRVQRRKSLNMRDGARAEELALRLAAIVESSDDAIISKDLNGTITSWNRAAERILGYHASEAIGQPIMMLIPPERADEEGRIISRVKAGERVEHFETVRRHKTGALVTLSITVSPIKDATGQVVGASKIARDISDRKQVEEQRELFLGELQHRTKNLLAVIEAIARHSRPRENDAAAAVLDGFVGRIRALLVTGEIAAGSSTHTAVLAEVFKQTLAPFDHSSETSSIRFEGPVIDVSEKTAGSLALAIHELATNALKYGALKSKSGRVSLTWEADDKGLITIERKESGGSPISRQPDRRGFGSRVIRSAVSHEPDSSTSLLFEPDGVRCTFQFRASADA